jgi:hypothetical protein
VHNDWPILLNVPAGQVLQAAEELLRVDGLYDPASHAAHAIKEFPPRRGLYVPAGQELQPI